MFSRILFTALVSSCFLFIGMAEVCLADFGELSRTDVSAELKQEEEYERAGRFEEAKSIHQQIIQNHPDSLYASKARLDISRIDVMSLIISKDFGRAKEALDKLIADFSGHPDLPEALYGTARQFEWQLELEDANSIYQQIIQNHPDSVYASKAELGIARAEVLSIILL